MHPGIRSWQNLVIYAFNAFSIPLLLKTLFAPWERDRGEDAPFDFLERFVFIIFTRILGFIARVFFIVCGLVFTLAVIISFPIFFLLPIKISRDELAHMGSFGAFLSYGNTFALNRHSEDLLSPKQVRMFGKDKSLRMIERGLAKDTNHNVLLVGETGVGKTTLCGYIGRLGQSGLSSLGIRNHRVVQLRTEGLSLEDFDISMEEARSAGNVIVVIEHIHDYEMLFDRLGNYLNSKELGIIATTDFSNYDQVLKNHPEFLVKFQKVEIDPTNPEDTLNVLYNDVSIRGTRIKKDALQEIVNLSQRLIHNQPEPLKSLLLLEELRSLDKKITIEDVRQVVSDKTNMPVGMIGVDEKKTLLGLEDKMRTKIIGQDRIPGCMEIF